MKASDENYDKDEEGREDVITCYQSHSLLCGMVPIAFCTKQVELPWEIHVQLHFCE